MIDAQAASSRFMFPVPAAARLFTWAMGGLLLASCGGGDPAATAASATRTETALAFFPPGPIPGTASTDGMWSPVYNWPLIGVHAVLLPDARVLTYGTKSDGTQTAKFIYDIWDGTGAPDSGHLTLPNGTPTDIFCSSQVLLPTPGASVFIAGGDNWTGTATTNTGNNDSNLFNGSANSLTPGADMKRTRWYSTSITLPNGETYIQGGDGGTDRPEVRALDGSFRLLTQANTSALSAAYPRNFVAPDGRVFGFEHSGKMYWVNPAGTGSITMAGQFNAAYTGWDASTAMFQPGRILQFGGSSNGAIVIDINSGTPVVQPTQSMSSQRRIATATILADGKVLAIGGSTVWNQLIGVNNSAEIWNPETGRWHQGALGDRARLYHSTALLLPDASVLVAGGGAPGPQNNLNAEIYYPPYLFTGSGERAARPTITSAPGYLEIGKTFTIDTGNAASIDRVVMVRNGSVTHGFNMDQRFLDLSFNRSGSQLVAQAPTHAGEAPPGYYMLFVLDAAGVPSVAKMVRIGIAADPDPSIVPTLTNPGPQSGQAGSPTTLALSASDPNGDRLTFSASGLPPGLVLNATTGAISGTPSRAGTFSVRVVASDGINADSVNFTWNVLDALPLTISPIDPPGASPSGSAIAFTASATGLNPQYRWNFGDGTPTTEWSSTPDATHVYGRAGSFVVTLYVTDDRGITQSRSFLQVVYLAPSAVRPTASSNLLVTPSTTGGNPRLWVLNQDNNSVTAFDAVTNERLAEIPVGAAPRAIAIAGNALLWITNKLSSSISVINPDTLSVVRTIPLPRASMPFGVAVSPSTGDAYVALEATGQVLRLDTTTFAQTAAMDVGLHPRHLSITADGAMMLVSRFITPPLPGESTATVNTPDDAGGEVLMVNPASMSLVRTVTLRHSNKPDFENQGRGIPNYLGAAVISPDGSHAWVPSKQDNVKRGALRDGTGLNFQNTVRAISSRIVLASGLEDAAARIDHDNASMASAALFDLRGVYLFVALETSREVAVIDAQDGTERLRFVVGRAPQGLALSPDGSRLFVNNFMDRSVGVFDLRPLLDRGELDVPSLATLPAVAAELLPTRILRGKQFFYDARDTRLARDRYMSCATCHNDGGHDGRVWDLTGQGEGLRNTVSLRGRAGGQGKLHWSNNFDEVQDFEGQIRTLAGGTGLMSNARFNAGTRSQPLGDPKAGQSSDLDALAAYVASLNVFDLSPFRQRSGALSTAATEGRTVFRNKNCAACHTGAAFTGSGTVDAANIGTLKPSSGQRLGGTLSGIDIPTLRDVWATGPYMHDGSASTLGGAVRAHNNVSVTDPELSSLTAYLREIGREEAAAPSPSEGGTGLTGRYFNNTTLTGEPVLVRNEAIDFSWGLSSPGAAIASDGFSARWSGMLQAPVGGGYQLRTLSDDGARVWVDDVLVIDDWAGHPVTAATSGTITLVAGQRYAIRVEYREQTDTAVMRLRWKVPKTSVFVAVPSSALYPG